MRQNLSNIVTDAGRCRRQREPADDLGRDGPSVERGDEHREEAGRERALEAVERDGVVRPAVGPHKKPHGLEARRNAAGDDGQQDVHHCAFCGVFSPPSSDTSEV